jgi:hypothetical protein
MTVCIRINDPKIDFLIQFLLQLASRERYSIIPPHPPLRGLRQQSACPEPSKKALAQSPFRGRRGEGGNLIFDTDGVPDAIPSVSPGIPFFLRPIRLPRALSEGVGVSAAISLLIQVFSSKQPASRSIPDRGGTGCVDARSEAPPKCHHEKAHCRLVF